MSRGKGKQKTQNDGLKELSKEQMAGVRQVFTNFDKNKDGTINTGELRTVMQLLGNNPTDKEIRTIMKEADKNGNHKLEFKEFAVLMAKFLKEPEEEELELLEAFRMFDKDDSGYIEVPEIKELLKNIGEKLSDEQLEEVFEKADLNGDGRLDYIEFVKMMTKPPN